MSIKIPGNKENIVYIDKKIIWGNQENEKNIDSDESTCEYCTSEDELLDIELWKNSIEHKEDPLYISPIDEDKDIVLQ